tara:strand:+ start:1480 stop:2400 length:921 start_codon:yes stop_codon:yes gene_type:complete
MNLSSSIKSKALEIGFSKIGIAKADFYKSDKLNLNSWIDKGYHASMQWIERRKEERANIKEYYPNSKSVISIAMNYFTGNSNDYFSNNKISNYAWGDDYHIVIKNKLHELLKYIKNIDDSINGICCVDTSPISEKVWAQRSGIGWIGKHTNLITRDFGTWVFLGEIILDVDLEYDQPFTKDLCGTCTLCIDACPTDALINEYQLDSNKCISYLTIEHRDEIPEKFQDKMNDWIYGCDICQEVCPWNKKFSIHSDKESFLPRDFLINNDADFLKSLSQEEYSRLFKNSAMKRTKISGLKRNIDFINN